MKKLKSLTIILCITLVTSFFGIIAYAAVNDVDLYYKTYITDDKKDDKESEDNNLYFNMDWLKSIPFVQDNFVDDIEDTVEKGWNNSMNFNFNNHYDKTGDTIEDTFSKDNINEIDITTDVASISFIQEDRSDIKVEYIYTKPDIDNYAIDYNAEIKNKTLNITQHIKTRNFSGNINKDNYKNTLTIYVPKDFSIDNLYIKNNLGDINNNDFYSNVSDIIDITTSLGQIDITISNPKKSVKLISALGIVKLNNNSEIDNLEIIANSGDVNIESNSAIKNCTITANLGTVKIISNDELNNCELEANMGSINTTFKKHIDSFNIICDMGEINMKLYDNDNSLISAKASMGDIKSDFDTTKKRSPYTIECSMGDITITRR
ncbi:hypothetical protein SH1V18_43420 [Vallitalea longa]|uniref:DUF4097 domain-containing protein n=1 Tax=Vallitalea longa TaxID=2936439 RepID=A0A9W6DHS0_9FIRM|nr:DUF4097 family beta strand repeat-containing protein [Vallitalea longa]GKX31862.1 hypothetical protein SH1V18_43420 [Vallitalea longa]